MINVSVGDSVSIGRRLKIPHSLPVVKSSSGIERNNNNLKFVKWFGLKSKLTPLGSYFAVFSDIEVIDTTRFLT